MRKRILSGMRPTGNLHIGHWVGALENWASLQDEYECFYMVADWHAVMSEYKDTSMIPGATISNVADWVACGVDPERSVLFVQSEIPEHTELWAAFSMVVPAPWLERCPTYREQMQELAAKEVGTFAFLGYPVLQAADILLYKGEVVPVGEDQLPHLELTREIIRRFNGFFGTSLPEPQAKLTKVPRLLGLDRRKMSKSYDNAIELGASAEEIRKKIATMFTDPQRLRRKDPGRPEICNVHDFYGIFQPELQAQVARECRGAEIGCTDCKARLADAVIRRLTPIREKRQELLADGDRRVREILDAGREKARVLARETMEEVRHAIFRR